MAKQQQQQQTDAKQQALQLANKQMGEIKRRVEMKAEEIRGLLGDVAHAQRLVMGSLMIIADDEKLRACDPASVVRSVLQAALVGAEAIAGLGEGYFIPYFNKDLGVNECTFMPGYRLAQRKIQEATAMRVIADVVCEKDHWKFSQVPLVLEHTPAEGDRGKRVRSYAVLLNDDGRVMFAQLASAEDVAKAKKAGHGDTPAWRTWEDRMWRKVAIMRLGKEARAYRTTAQLDALVEAESAAFELRRGFIGDMPEVRALPPGVPEEGRAKVGSSTKKPEPEPQKEAPPADAKPAEEKPPERAPLMQTMDLVKSSKSKDDLDRIYVVETDGGQEPRKEVRAAIEKRWAELQESSSTTSPPTDEPPHDSETGEVIEGTLCAQPGCDSPATHGVYCGGHKPPEKGQARMGGAGF